MGTRADFYVGRGAGAEWLGSIAWDGHPDSMPEAITSATTPDGYRGAVAQFLATRDDATAPESGWPWPWDDSRTTDYAYALDGDKVWGSCCGHGWFDATQPEPDDSCEGPKDAVFPSMKDRRRMAEPGITRSGLMVVSLGRRK